MATGVLGPMGLTRFDDVNEILAVLLPAMRGELGDALLGLYLYGSAASGDYLAGISDVDLLAVTATEADERGLAGLRRMHDAVARGHPAWDDHIEVQYMPRAALATFRTQPGTIVAISPGEPIHFREADRLWTMNWYDVQENGVTLFGPPSSTFVPLIGCDEFVAAVRSMMPWWVDNAAERAGRPGSRAYVILTMCRTLYTSRTGHQASKEDAAGWAESTFPAWAELIRAAMAWRREGSAVRQPDGVGTSAQTVEFVRFANEVVDSAHG